MTEENKTVESETVQETQEQSGETQSNSGFVDIADATDEELQAHLSDESTIAEEPNEEQPEPDNETKASEEPQEEAAVEEQDDSEKTKENDTDYIKKLEEQVAQQEAFIQRQKTEVGKARKSAEDAKAEYAKRNEEINKALKEIDADLDPSKLMDLKLEQTENKRRIKEFEDQVQELEAEDIALSSVQTNTQMFNTHVPEGDRDFNGMAESLKADGVPMENIQAFLSNPYAQTDGLALIQLARRTKAEKLLKQVASLAKSLKEENEALKKKPSELLSKVEKNLRRPTAVTNSNGGGSSTRATEISESEIDSLSDQELKDILDAAA